MRHTPNNRILTLFLGDIFAFYLSLVLALLIRGGGTISEGVIMVHLPPFSVALIGFLLSFYLAGLYDIRQIRGGIDLMKTVAWALGVGIVLSVLFFYLTPGLSIAPKTNLLLFLLCFSGIELVWRRSYIAKLNKSEPPYRVLLVGDSAPTRELAETLEHSPQLGYTLAGWLKTQAAPEELARRMSDANVLVVPRHLRRDDRFARALYGIFASGIPIRDTPTFYEFIFKKVPLEDLEETWFLENLVDHYRSYDQLKSALEFAAALILQIILLPIELLIWLSVRLSSPGPAIYRQERIGRAGQKFTLYKFRSMYNDKKLNPDADSQSPTWTKPNDSRVTPLGRVLRASHLDELPQLLNVLRGEISFVGPRAERPEFVEHLKKEVPHYEIRHLIRPGITGWAQINYPYGSSVEDASRKLEFDIYYLKNRSLILDMAIGIRTLRSFFVNPRK